MAKVSAVNLIMFGYVDKSKGLLFSSYDLQAVLKNQVDELCREVEKLEQNRLMNTSQADLINYLVEKFAVTPVSLQKENIYAEESEVQVDVRYDSMRCIDDKSRPALVPGQQIRVKIPFIGDEGLFYSASNQRTSNPPRAKLANNEIVFSFEMPNDSPRDLKPEIDSSIANIEQHLSRQLSMISAHNSSLSQHATEVINNRRERLLANSSRLVSLGIPIKVRGDAPKTYISPEIRKKVVPSMPLASSTPFEPEPILDLELYEHILTVIQNMALVMERSPSSFIKMDEESLRQHFLVQLNGQFEGKATGETFNVEGKTDILLKENSKNVFIAECKFWKGQKGFSETIDQLLGYTAWRDSKTAILIFNRGTEMTKVLSAMKETAKAHPNFKREDPAYTHETGARYVFHNKNDPNREFLLTVIVFDVPH